MVDDSDPDHESREELEDAVMDFFDEVYHDTIRWEIDGGREHFERDITNISDDDLEYILTLSQEQLENFAEYSADDAPDWLIDMGWYDDDGEWHNPFWYH